MEGIQVLPQVLRSPDLCLFAASPAGLPGPSRDLQGRQRPPGGAPGARSPEPQQVRASGKVREWESQVRGSEELGEDAGHCNSGACLAHSGRTTQLPSPLPGATGWALQARPSPALVSAARFSPAISLPSPLVGGKFL